MSALKAKAVLCPGLTISFFDEVSGTKETWCFLDGLAAYLTSSNEGADLIPKEPFEGEHMTEEGGMTWALQWVPWTIPSWFWRFWRFGARAPRGR